MTRGDTALLVIPLYQENESEYILQEGDTAYFCIKLTVADEAPIFLKEFKGNGVDQIKFSLEAAETKELLKRKYVYEVSIELDRGEEKETFVRTVIDKARLVVTDELH